MPFRAALFALALLSATTPTQAATVTSDLSSFASASFVQGNPAVRFRSQNTGRELFVGVPENGNNREERELPYIAAASFSILYTRATGVISAQYRTGAVTSYQMMPGASFNAMRIDILGPRTNGNYFTLTDLVANGTALASTLGGGTSGQSSLTRSILWNFADLEGNLELTGTLNYFGPFGNASGAEQARVDIRLGNVSPVPLPAAGWMLLASLGGLAVLARRRKAT